jgi:LPXTG-motif cell wall-anchored protein
MSREQRRAFSHIIRSDRNAVLDESVLVFLVLGIPALAAVLGLLVWLRRRA